MTNIANQDDPNDDEVNRYSVADPDLHKTRLLSAECATCIFRPGNLMHLDPGRLRQLVAEARRNGSYIICHNTLPHHVPGARPAICRGFFNRYRTWQLQVISRLWGFAEVEPTAPEQATRDADITSAS